MAEELSNKPEQKNEKIAMDNNATSQQELVEKDGVKKRRRKYLMIAAAIVLVIIVIALIAALQGSDKESSSSSPSLTKSSTTKTGNITVDDYLSGKYNPKSFNGTWISDKEILYMDEDRNLQLMDVKEMSVRLLLSTLILAQYRLAEYHLSPDQQYLMLIHDYQKLFRYSFLARYTIYDLRTNEAIPLQTTSEGPHNEQLQYAVWAPNSTAIAFVHNNDVYYRANPRAESIRITTTGIVQTDSLLGPIYNGVADWVYEEEVLSSHSAMWFSPDGNKLAFATFNDTGVEHIHFPYYGPFNPNNQYPIITSIPYPKSGTHNPTISLQVLDLKLNTITTIAPPADLAAGDYYFTAVGWAGNNDVTVIWLNRTQNLAFLEMYSSPGYSGQQLQRFTSEGWLSIYDAPVFNDDGSAYIMILPVKIDDDTWPHIVYIDTNSGVKTPLTKGHFTVSKIKYWNTGSKQLYFKASPEGGPSERHIYKITGMPTVLESECLTCGRNNYYSDPCVYNNAHFSKQAKYVVHSCEGTETVAKVSVEETDSGKELLIWQDNKNIQENMEEMPELTYIKTEVEVPGGFKARVVILLPLDYEEGSSKKHPMVVYTYGGPNSQMTTDSWRGIDWGGVLSSHGIVYAMIDGRGSGYAGNNLLFQIYRQLGTVEVQDQIHVAKKLTEKYSWIDGDNVGIWGWSYGGYVSGMALATQSENVFKCAVSVAPVTSWMYYDSIYTERYMGLPYYNDNFEAYNNTDISNHVEGFRGKKYYLIHGNADDNVHYQQSMMLSKKLEHSDILFRQQSYPDEAHGLSSVRRHLYLSMEKFWMDCFGMNS